jgi:hypothetical protein
MESAMKRSRLLIPFIFLAAACFAQAIPNAATAGSTAFGSGFTTGIASDIPPYFKPELAIAWRPIAMLSFDVRAALGMIGSDGVFAFSFEPGFRVGVAISPWDWLSARVSASWSGNERFGFSTSAFIGLIEATPFDWCAISLGSFVAMEAIANPGSLPTQLGSVTGSGIAWRLFFVPWRFEGRSITVDIADYDDWSVGTSASPRFTIAWQDDDAAGIAYRVGVSYRLYGISGLSLATGGLSLFLGVSYAR